jgi:hypothetical protein
MTEVIKKEIMSLLDRIVVFEVKFKQEVLEKLQSLDEAKLSELKNILLEVTLWQEKILTKTMETNPGLYARLANAKKQAEQGVINLYTQEVKEVDRQKMQIILDKINSI